MMDQLEIQETRGETALADIHSLRYEILRKPHGLSIESAVFPHDELESTIHLVARRGNEILGCVSLMPHEDGATIQLRGMAVSVDYQGRGVGSRLLGAAHAIADRENKSMWCNARLSAIGFYERYDWTTEGEFFEVPVIGKHAIMKRAKKHQS